ncbi:MAG: hypothetical protein O2995_03175 [Proteobacteria bacterium]|nr:hypothetical protein [Pseudomonadota bacterium]
MISATHFARRYTSYWQELTPTADLYLRRINLALSERFAAPMESEVVPSRRGLVNEVAYWAYGETLIRSQATVDTQIVEAAITIALRKATDRGTNVSSSTLADEELNDVLRQVNRLRSVFRGGVPISFAPALPGCGFVGRAEADLVRGKALVELKAGARTFRAVDLRQLMTYLALDAARGGSGLESVMLVNIRQGNYFEATIEELASQTAGRPPTELLGDIIDLWSNGAISR